MTDDNDRGLLLGDGLFETLLVVRGTLQDWPAHFQRMSDGCRVLGLPVPHEADALVVCQQALQRLPVASTLTALRLTLTAGAGGRGLERPDPVIPRLFARASPYVAPRNPVRLVTSSLRRNSHSPSSRLKTLAYIDQVLARREAQIQGADDALMLDSEGMMACTTAANLFWVSGGAVYTPALSGPVLPGVRRQRVLGACRRDGVRIHEVTASPDQLQSADGGFITNSLIGAQAISEVDGVPLPGSSLAARLVEQHASASLSR